MGGEQACVHGFQCKVFMLNIIWYCCCPAIPHLLQLPLQPVEYILNAVLAVFLLVTGKWVAASIHICISLYNLRIYLQREHIVDVTEIFRQLPKQKMMRMIKLVIFLFSFVLIIYRCASALHNACTKQMLCACCIVIADYLQAFCVPA